MTGYAVQVQLTKQTDGCNVKARLVRWHLSIGLDAVLEAEKLPASIADLDAALTCHRASPIMKPDKAV